MTRSLTEIAADAEETLGETDVSGMPESVQDALQCAEEWIDRYIGAKWSGVYELQHAYECLHSAVDEHGPNLPERIVEITSELSEVIGDA